MASPVYRFSDFRLDPASRELWRGDQELVLPRRVFDCIVYLIEHRDRAVERDELFAAVWGDAQLSDGVLAQAVLEARKALGDSGDGQLLIKTIRGFGYHWVAPVEAVETPTEKATRTGGGRRWLWVVGALLALGAVVAAMLYLRRDREPGGITGVLSPPGSGSIALLLPVEADVGPEHAWVRLGIMDLIATHLREAGQVMVPSESVIALVQGLAPEPSAQELDSLAAATGAHLVLTAQAQASGTRWTVSLHTLYGAQPPLTAFGEAPDVLEAARIAADGMARSLGLRPADEPGAEPAVARLVQRVEAAVLAQQMDVARELIQAAPPELRGRPEVRVSLAWIEYNSVRLDTAQAMFEALLKEEAVQRNSRLRVRELYGLSGVYLRKGELDRAESVLKEAAVHADQEWILDNVQATLGLLELTRGNLDAARAQLALARRGHEATGDVRGLAVLDNNLGVLAFLRERFVEADYYFDSAADRAAALHDIGKELDNRANAVEVRLGLLDPQVASDLEPRLDELLADTGNPVSAAHAKLAMALLMDARGETEAAERLLTDVLQAAETREDLRVARLPALVAHAERLARTGRLLEAGRVAAEVVDQAPSQYDVLQDDGIGRAWLIVVRGHIARRDLAAAADALAAMSDWVERSGAPSPTIYAALAEAELAAAERRDGDAAAAFERALALADAGQVPLRLLQVAEHYVPWLLGRDPDGAADPERALIVADRVARYADRHYGAALLQLRVYHALGPPSAWRAALARARALAGERRIPPDLQEPPQTQRVPTRG